VWENFINLLSNFKQLSHQYWDIRIRFPKNITKSTYKESRYLYGGPFCNFVVRSCWLMLLFRPKSCKLGLNGSNLHFQTHCNGTKFFMNATTTIMHNHKWKKEKAKKKNRWMKMTWHKSNVQKGQNSNQHQPYPIFMWFSTIIIS